MNAGAHNPEWQGSDAVAAQPPQWYAGLTALWRRVVAALQRSQKISRGPNRLQVTETISLGERRFVAVVQVDGGRYLIGGTAANLVMLATIHAPVSDPGKPLSALLPITGRGGEAA